MLQRFDGVGAATVMIDDSNSINARGCVVGTQRACVLQFGETECSQEMLGLRPTGPGDDLDRCWNPDTTL